MAINVDILAGYITQEIVTEFNLGQSNESLEKYAQAMSRAISRYLKDNVEVAIGQQVIGQGIGETDMGDKVTTDVTGKVVTKGKLV